MGLAKVVVSGRMTKNQYYAVHNWMRYNFTKPKLCAICNNEKQLDWSNISGNYIRDISDWRALCRKCHKRIDTIGNTTHCRKEHEMTPENTYTYSDGRVECRICRKNNRKNKKVE